MQVELQIVTLYTNEVIFRKENFETVLTREVYAWHC
jgi:hypothetical protein